MRYLLFILCLFVATSVYAQGDMRVYTVAGGIVGAPLGDGGPATAANIDNTEGIWMDANCNLYISDMTHKSIRKVNTNTGIITTIAGNGTSGFSGDGGPATNAQINVPYGLFSDPVGNVYVADQVNERIRRVDAATGIITTFAGGGSSLGDGGPATNAQIGKPRNVYGDQAGNIYIAGDARIRKVNPSGIITTLAGTGSVGLSGDGGPATNAQIAASVAGMIMDASGNLYIADRSNSRIRKISAGGIITTVAGTSLGFSGDGGPATAAKLGAPISIFFNRAGDLIIGDNQNDRIRKVDASTGTIITIAGVLPGSTAEGVPATAARIHPEFLYMDLDSNIYFSTYSNRIRKITNYLPGLAASGSTCTKHPEIIHVNEVMSGAISIYPNPTNDLLTIELQTTTNYTLLSIVGTTLQQGQLHAGSNTISLSGFPAGIYFVALTGAGGERSVTRIIKQ